MRVNPHTPGLARPALSLRTPGLRLASLHVGSPRLLPGSVAAGGRGHTHDASYCAPGWRLSVRIRRDGRRLRAAAGARQVQSHCEPCGLSRSRRHGVRSGEVGLRQSLMWDRR